MRDIMSEKHRMGAVARRFKAMSRKERIAKIRKLASVPAEDK